MPILVTGVGIGKAGNVVGVGSFSCMLHGGTAIERKEKNLFMWLTEKWYPMFGGGACMAFFIMSTMSTKSKW